jgi:hypothetical protein
VKPAAVGALLFWGSFATMVGTGVGGWKWGLAALVGACAVPWIRREWVK